MDPISSIQTILFYTEPLKKGGRKQADPHSPTSPLRCYRPAPKDNHMVCRRLILDTVLGKLRCPHIDWKVNSEALKSTLFGRRLSLYLSMFSMFLNLVLSASATVTATATSWTICRRKTLEEFGKTFHFTNSVKGHNHLDPYNFLNPFTRTMITFISLKLQIFSTIIWYNLLLWRWRWNQGCWWGTLGNHPPSFPPLLFTLLLLSFVFGKPSF